ncbi:unnamed protein product [Lactuca virosa]|uniref:Uncharacterized protein n=1 Tax=Lactuca virosa TaxID=75947 RepID=A0AAU9PQ05_9ASTR|nr:unnamed protein product [Lactuca virosa]
MGKCNMNPLYVIRRDTDLSSIYWCNFIVDCLIRTKKVYNPDKESSFFYGPATYLMINEPYAEEECQESNDDKEESDGDEDLSDDDEEEFDVNQVSVVEISEDLRNELVVKLNDGVLKFPERKGGGVEDVNDTALEGQNDKNDSQGKVDGPEGDVNEHAHEEHISKINDLLNEKDDDKNYDVVGKGNFGNEDDEQGNTSGFNEEEVMNLNSIVENVVKRVGQVDGDVNDIYEGLSFRQFMRDPIVENFLNHLDQGNENLVECGTINLVEDDKNKEGILDDTVDKVIGEKKKEDELIAPTLVKVCAEGEVENSKANNDGVGVVECEAFKLIRILEKR